MCFLLRSQTGTASTELTYASKSWISDRILVKDSDKLHISESYPKLHNILDTSF